MCLGVVQEGPILTQNGGIDILSLQDPYRLHILTSAYNDTITIILLNNLELSQVWYVQFKITSNCISITQAFLSHGE